MPLKSVHVTFSGILYLGVGPGALGTYENLERRLRKIEQPEPFA